MYFEFCTMAFDDEEVFWVSETREIFSPYFGNKMLKCREVKETL